jgi:hypothetical protein
MDKGQKKEEVRMISVPESREWEERAETAPGFMGRILKEEV